MLETFFHPQSVAVVGASREKQKLGSMILQNLIGGRFKGKIVGINPKYPGKKIRGTRFYSSLEALDYSVDLAIIVVPAKFVESVIKDAVKNKTKNLIIISAGFKEVGNAKLESRIAQLCEKNDINLLGPNCLGAIFPHAQCNASFSDGHPLKGNVCFVSQSGAFCTAMLDWASEHGLGFSHFISLGNKAGLGENEILEALKDDPQIGVFAFYLESLKDGPAFLQILRKVTPHKPVIILEPGESQKASQASSSHTGSLAPNFKVMQQAYRQCGAIQVETMEEMFGTIYLSVRKGDKVWGPRTAIITNAGGVGVHSTDLCAKNGLSLPRLSPEVEKALSLQLPLEASLKNPIDLIGDAPPERYAQALGAVVRDPKIDQILVLLTPQRTTQVRATAKIIARLAQKTDKNIVASFIGGERVRPGIDYLKKHGIPHFRFPNDALSVMGLLSKKQGDRRQGAGGRKKKDPIPNAQCLTPNALKQIKHTLCEAKKSNLPSLSQDDVTTILKAYKIDVPRSENVTSFTQAQAFAKKIFPQKLVAKISSPHALHKTELKGIVLNIDTAKKLKDAWTHLSEILKKAQIKDACVQLQEQIEGASEVILGINTDPTFGRVMLGGSGGIYTEIMADTATRLLPTKDFKSLINQTKVGQILHGTRGQKPKAVGKLIHTMERLQQLALDFPEIRSIDLNPLLVTEKRAVAVDTKLILQRIKL